MLKPGKMSFPSPNMVKQLVAAGRTTDNSIKEEESNCTEAPAPTNTDQKCENPPDNSKKSSSGLILRIEPPQPSNSTDRPTSTSTLGADLKTPDSPTSGLRTLLHRMSVSREPSYPGLAPHLGDSSATDPNGDVRKRPQTDQTTPTKTSAQKKPQTKQPMPPGSPRARWSKLRTAMTMTTAITQPAKLKKRGVFDRQDSFIKKFTTQRGGIDDEGDSDDVRDYRDHSDSWRIAAKGCVVDPQGTPVVVWLGIVTVAVLYNLWTSIARQAFIEIRVGYEPFWFLFDGLADMIYILDIILQLRTSYLERGLTVSNSKKLACRYIHSKNFIVDLCSIFPLDLLQFLIGIQPMIRFPRFLKVYRASRWKTLVENRTVFPNTWRVANLTHILFLGCHWFAAFYFMISQAEGFKTDWGYPEPKGEFASVTRKYLKSVYWATLTLTTIGDLPPPDNNWEYVFTIASYLIGVFVFATIVGQIGNVITNRNATRLEFEKILDNAKNYMRMHNVPQDLQRRVLRWYDYAWSRGRTDGGGDINALALLPDKLKTEMALHVNLETLKKVTIFQECRPEFLHDLVLKMRPYIFTPGDLICRKGEVAREMFIIADGVLEVISEAGEVLTKMGAGDFFGEIGILNLDGGVNRRTADVKSIGYSELFVLSKEDVLSALKDHPDAEFVLLDYARRRLDELHQRSTQPISRDKSPSDVIAEVDFKTIEYAPRFTPSTGLPSHGVEALLKCVNDMVNARIIDTEQSYLRKIRVLEEANTDKESRIKLLEDQLKSAQHGGIQNTAFENGRPQSSPDLRPDRRHSCKRETGDNHECTKF